MSNLKKNYNNYKLTNENLDPIEIKNKNWFFFNYVCLWASLSITIPTYMLGSSLIGFGMNWWQASFTILLGNCFIVFPMILISHAGAKYGISFPVLLRSSFGFNGAKFISIFRALIACGWFGIQSTLGGLAFYSIFLLYFPNIKNLQIIKLFDINSFQILCIFTFIFLQVYSMKYGMFFIKKISLYIFPLLFLSGLLILYWAYFKIGNVNKILEASYLINKLNNYNNVELYNIFWPCFAAVIGFWATLILNIPDFTRFAYSQKSHIFGQFVAMPTIMFVFSFIGIFVTSASFILFGKPLWNPIDLIKNLDSNMLKLISTIIIMVATFVSNIIANLVASSNDFSNLMPKNINFLKGAIITGIIGFVIMPWKLIDNPQGYILKWLVSYSSFFGAFSGIIISDYYLIRKTKIDLSQLYVSYGIYHYTKGWNICAIVTLFLSVMPSIPGLLAEFNILNKKIIPDFINHLYNYSWFISFFLSILIYKTMMKYKNYL